MRRYAWAALRPWKRHSLVVGLGGIVYFLVGLVYILTPTSPQRAASMVLMSEVAPLSVWGIGWMIAGTLAFISTRWPPASETWGYTALSALAAIWATGYGLSILLFGAPISGLSGMFVWYLVAFMWWGIAGLRNPDDVLAELREVRACCGLSSP